MAANWRGVGTALGRGARLTAVAALIVASLLTFPNEIPIMIGVWLGVHGLAVARGGAGWFPLVTCAAIVVVKGTWPTGGLLLLGIAMSGSAALGALGQFRSTRRGRQLMIGSNTALWIAWGVMLIGWRDGVESTASIALDGQATIVCLGDSLTANDDRIGSYPEILQDTLAPNRVINLGQPGITTAEALSKLSELRRLEPTVVVVELGGHDFLRGLGRATAKANLERIIAEARNAGAVVVLVEIPRGFIFDPWFGLERQLARELDLTLVPDGVIRSFVLNSPFAPPGMWRRGPHLSDDGLHPNRLGNQAFATAVARAIEATTRR